MDSGNSHGVDLAGPNIGQQLLQGRAVEGGPRETPIVVAIGHQASALMGPALDVSFAGLALGIERVELEVEIMLGRLASEIAQRKSFRAVALIAAPLCGALSR